MTKQIAIFTVAICTSAGLASAQPPAPPPAGAAPAATNPVTVSGAISQLNYGPDGSIDGFVLSGNTLVYLAPVWAMRLSSTIKPGEQVSATGQAVPASSSMRILDAQTLQVDGKTLSMPQPGAPAPYIGTGTIRQLNYGPQGEVNGFVLQNGMIAQMPPFGANANSILKPGMRIGVSGFEEAAPSGATVIHVQSIGVNGQTLNFNAPPPAPMGGPAGAPPPPPQAPPAPPAR
ncbi:MAG: hypothetical protein ACRD4O_05360 [Bryobacteraceae bacterium]